MKFEDLEVLCYDHSEDGGELEDEDEEEEEEVILNPEFDDALEEYEDALEDDDEDEEDESKKTSNPSFEKVIKMVVNFDEAKELVNATPDRSAQEKRAYEKFISLAPNIEAIEDIFKNWRNVGSHDLEDAKNKRLAELETQQI